MLLVQFPRHPEPSTAIWQSEGDHHTAPRTAVLTGSLEPASVYPGEYLGLLPAHHYHWNQPFLGSVPVEVQPQHALPIPGRLRKEAQQLLVCFDQVDHLPPCVPPPRVVIDLALKYHLGLPRPRV